jgi:hypothetical protein
MKRYLAERLTYDQLFRASDPKRVYRSFKVKGPPLELDSYQDAAYYAFNFKSFPSTTGLRHRGYVKFVRPRLGGQKPLQHLECVVDCTCPDFRYRWAWANKQRGSSRVGAQSLNQALNRAPRHTNPKSKPGLCKHILAAREYIYGLLSSFPNTEPDTAEKLNKLTRFAQRRWINFPEQMRAAKERDRQTALARQQRNIGQEPQHALPLVPEPPVEPDDEEREPGDEEAYVDIVPPDIGEQPAAAPGQADVRRIRKPIPKVTTKKEQQAAQAGFSTPAEYEFSRRQGLGDSLQQKPKTTRVVNANGLKTNMNTLTEAQNIIVELEQDELANIRRGEEDADLHGGEALPPGDDMGGGPGPGEMGDEMGAGPDLDLPPDDAGGLPPSEAPVSDTAVGADAQGSEALQLLREIRDFLGQLAAVLSPAPEGGEGEEGSEGEGGGFPGEIEGAPEEEGAEGAVPEPPSEEEEGESREEEEEEHEDEDKESADA